MIIRGMNETNIWDYENAFYWYSSPTRLNKLLAHFELYKSISDLPGHILEFGVFKGVSLIRLATFRSTLENDFARKIVGFDAFGKFPKKGLKLKIDQDFSIHHDKSAGNGLDIKTLKNILNKKGFKNIELIKGNIIKTLPKYLDDNPETRIAFLHLDMDVKEPTDLALNLLFDRVVPGGLIILDDYNAVAGETISVDEFVKKNKLKIEKLPYYYLPAFIRKPFK